MKILNALSIKDLKLNKKRSLVIIIGIILSTALICGVAGLVSSFQKTLVDYQIQSEGNYHVEFYNVPKEELKYIEENRNVDKYYLSENIGYAKFEKSENKKKPYLHIVSMDDSYLNNMGVNLVEGRLPENSNELVISKHIQTNGKVDLKVGDTITLQVGKRQLTTGEELNQENPYVEEDEDREEGETEEIVDTYIKQYTIVGVAERPSYSIEGFEAPGYTVITKMDTIGTKANIAVLYKNLFKYQEYTEDINQMVKASDEDKKNNKDVIFGGMRGGSYKSFKYDMRVNAELLAYKGANLSDGTMEVLYAAGGIVMVIILVTSVFVIRNGFAISVTERLKQYGMLSSIGATKKQIKKTVFFEGFVLGIIGIPLGILSGIFAIDVVIKIVNIILKDYVMEETLLVYSISWFAIIISIIIAIITIWFSCKSSARKASKVTPIEAIRSSNDIKLKAKKIKCPKIISKIFKTGGEIAYKNLKRSKKKYRTTVISIIVSIVTFIAISSFIEYGFKMTGVYYTEIGYNINVYELDDYNKEGEIGKIYNRFLDISKLDGVDEYSIHRINYMVLDTTDYLTDLGKQVKVNNVKRVYEGENAKEDTIEIHSLGDKEYKNFIQKIGGKYEDYKDGAILIDDCVSTDEEGKNIQGSLYNLKKGDSITGKLGISQESVNNTKTQTIRILGKTTERPMGLQNLYSYSAYLIVSDEYIEKIGYENLSALMINAKDSFKVEDEINQFYKEKGISENDYIVSNIDEQVKANNAIILVVSIFLYGFIAVISLIGITNIFNTITTNMNLRKKEFAMLKSIGMTRKEFNRMIRLESIFYGLKSLVIGLPIGIGLSYLISRAFSSNLEAGYILPFKAIAISIIFVILIIGIIMRYSMRKINKQNIIETIRNDNI